MLAARFGGRTQPLAASREGVPYHDFHLTAQCEQFFASTRKSAWVLQNRFRAPHSPSEEDCLAAGVAEKTQQIARSRRARGVSYYDFHPCTCTAHSAVCVL